MNYLFISYFICRGCIAYFKYAEVAYILLWLPVRSPTFTMPSVFLTDSENVLTLIYDCPKQAP